MLAKSHQSHLFNLVRIRKMVGPVEIWGIGDAVRIRTCSLITPLWTRKRLQKARTRLDDGIKRPLVSTRESAR